MIPINDIFDFLIMAGVLTLAVLAAVARRRIFRSNERVKIRPSDWLVLSDSPPSLHGVTPRRNQPPLSNIGALGEPSLAYLTPAEPVQRQMRVPTKVTKQK
jgi:hypothetical protein